MIRRRDQVRLSVQKLGLRKKRALFSVVSVALGVVLVVVINSLARSVRDLAVRTSLTEEIDQDVVRVYAEDSPYEYMAAEDKKEPPPRKRIQFLTETLFDQWRGWTEVEAVAHPVTVGDVGMDALTNQPRAVSQLTGVPDALLRRYISDPHQLAACSNAIPLVIGERFARLRYNRVTKDFELTDTSGIQAWLGRELTLQLGDPFANLARFRRDREKKQWLEVDADDLVQRRETIERNVAAAYDRTIYSSRLPLRARVVGFCPGARVLVPVATAALCEKWLALRRDLAAVQPRRSGPSEEYGARGRRAPRTGEFAEGLLLVKPGASADAVATRLRKLGFTATTRSSAFESFIKEFDSGLRFVKRIAYAIAAVILAIAAGLLWSTASRIVSDSRADIGLFRALGATKHDVRRLFLGETVLLGLLGTLAGLLAGWTLGYYISRWVVRVVGNELNDPEEILRVPASLFTIDLRFAALLLVGAAVISWVAGLWPARRAANIDPVKALKRE